MTNKYLSVLGLAVILSCTALVGCGIEADDQERSDVINVKPDDPAMLAAIGKARLNVGKFITALEDPQPNQQDFSVKMKVVDGDLVEHMWLSDPRYEDGVFIGALSNEPRDVKNVKYGDEMRVPRDEISDWMFFEDGYVVGGYSVKVIRDMMPPDQQAAFDAEMQFKDE